MDSKELSGANRKPKHLLFSTQQRVTKQLLPLIPSYIQSYHLTLFTIPLGLLIIFGAEIYTGKPVFLVVQSIAILLQYITDMLDGALGRYRNGPFVTWGFYMDHIMDYFFSFAIVLSYALYFQIQASYTGFLMAVIGAYFVHEFILGTIFGKVNVMGYKGFGPSELQVFFVFFSLFLAFTNYWISDADFLSISLYLFLGLVWVILKAQTKLWKLDKAKHRTD